MYDLIEYSLWMYYRHNSALDNYGNIIDFLINDDTSLSFKNKKT